MSITLPTPPDGAAQAALVSLNLTSGDRLAPLSVVYPHRVYLMDLAHVASGSSLEAAQAGPWRFLVAHNSRLEEYLDVVGTDASGRHRLAHRSRGSRSVAAGLQIVRALAAPEFSDGRLEGRMLEIPALSVTALWLAGENRSVLIPIAPARGLNAGSQYSPDEFLAALQPAAKERLRFDNSPKPRDGAEEDNTVTVTQRLDRSLTVGTPG
jgi:hypothetical protein